MKTPAVPQQKLVASVDGKQRYLS